MEEKIILWWVGKIWNNLQIHYGRFFDNPQFDLNFWNAKMILNQHVKFSKSWNPRIQLGLLERVGGSQKHEDYYTIFSYTHAHVGVRFQVTQPQL
jgi:hypothetical protein